MKTANIAGKISFQTLSSSMGGILSVPPLSLPRLGSGAAGAALEALSSLLFLPPPQLVDASFLTSKNEWASLAKSEPRTLKVQEPEIQIISQVFQKFSLNLDQMFSGPLSPRHQEAQLLLGTRHSTHDILFIPCKPFKMNTIVPIIFMRTLSSVWWSDLCKVMQLRKGPINFDCLLRFPASLDRCVLCV